MNCVGCNGKGVVVVSQVSLCSTCCALYRKIRRAMTLAFRSKAA